MQQATTVGITIIGMGPRGLSVFERIAAFARASRCRLQLNLVEPEACGPGVHAVRQPAHLMINTVASQVTIFPAPHEVATMPACATPSLTEWARGQGYRRFGDQFLAVGADCAGGEALADNDHLPRQLLGAYLAWAFGAIRATLPATVSLAHFRQRAVDMFQQPDASFVVELESGYTVASDFVFLTTGHSRNELSDEEAWCRQFAQEHARYNSKLAFVRHVYPLTRLVAIDSGAKVAIQGLGLTAHDVIAELTAGRGGRFVREGTQLRYAPSGLEPALMLFSRNCLPAAARAINQKGVSGRHQCQFFTLDAVRALRSGGGQLDFERQLLPLLRREMGYAWRCARDGAPPPSATYQLGPEEEAALDSLLFPLRGRQFADGAAFGQYFRAMLIEDMRQAELGNLRSPLKAAADVLRDVRAVLQEAVEHGALTPASHRKFLSVYNPAINRVTFGPPRERNAQLMALIDAGLLTVAAGPNTQVRIDEDRSQFALHTRLADGAVVQHADALLVARLDVYSPETDDSELTRNLLKRGIIRPFYNGNFHPGGLDIDRGGHPLGRNGRPSVNLWALGYLVEGAHYYTHALPRPQLGSRQVRDAERCVGELFAALGQRAQPAGATEGGRLPAL